MVHMYLGFEIRRSTSHYVPRLITYRPSLPADIPTIRMMMARLLAFPALSTGNTLTPGHSTSCTNTTPYSSKTATTTRGLTQPTRFFVPTSLRRCFPKGLIDRHELDVSMRKNYTSNWFHSVFVQMAGGLGIPTLKLVASEYVSNVRDGTGKP